MRLSLTLSRLLLLVPLVLIACREGGVSPQATPALVENTPAAAEVNTTAVATTTNPAIASSSDSPTPEPPPPTPTLEPEKEIVVCMAAEPANLFLYGDNSPAAVALRHALYESPVTSLSHAYQPLALETLPSLAGDDAVLETITVSEGQRIVNAEGKIVPLRPGEQLVDSSGVTVTFDGEPVEMQQLRVQFQFQPLVWSDGQPVTAEDSVFSFEIAADPATEHLDPRLAYTADYSVTGERQVEWTGLPGYLPDAYQTFVWTPLPAHALGSVNPAELANSEDAARAPLAYGPFQVDSWLEGKEIRLTRNPEYYRAAEGLPLVSSIVVRFVGPSPDGLPEGYEACDVITADGLGLESLPALEASASDLQPYAVDAAVFEYLMFGINPSAAYEASRPGWFEDATVRQAIAACIDREALVEQLAFGQTNVLNTFVTADHPLYPAGGVAEWPFDRQAANALLDAAGYQDTDGDGTREDIEATSPFSITIGTNNESPLRLALSQAIVGDLAECGIAATTLPVPAGSWFASGPEGPLFGRQFDLALVPWVDRIEPNCGLFLSGAIPGPVIEGFSGWQDVNVSGWASEAYDAQCHAALRTLPGQPGYAEAHAGPMSLVAEALPALPLFPRSRLAAARTAVSNFRPDSTQPSELWNIYEWDIEEDN